jgi:hypothetical protein
MSVVFSGTNQGKFTSTGANKILNIRSDVDWINVYNYTAATQAVADLGFQYYFQRGMAQGTGIIYSKLGAVANDPVTVATLTAPDGFYLIDTSVNVPGASVALTEIDSQLPLLVPVVSTANTAGLNDGDIVRIFSVIGGLQYNGLDFTIDGIVANTSFNLAFFNIQNVTTGVTTGTFRKIPYNPIYYPRARYISSITNAVNPEVQLSVTHGYKVGQVVRFIVPSVAGSATTYGMTEINNLQGTILAINLVNNTITVDIDTSGFTAFTLPLSAQAASGYTPAQVVPIGQNTAESLDAGVDILTDATVNEALVGILLTGGADKPGGDAADVMYWVAGKSFSVSN